MTDLPRGSSGEMRVQVPFADWQPIETAPKDGTRIIAFIDDAFAEQVDLVYWQPGSRTYDLQPHPTVAEAFVKVWEDTEGYWVGTQISPVTAYFWMPLPSKPSVQFQEI